MTADEPQAPAGGEEQGGDTVNYRQLYETELRKLPRDVRVSMARVITGSRLRALCFDPEAQVVRALLDNPTIGPEHARLVAAHHRTSTGLDALARRPAFLADPEVRRLLLRNVQSGEPLLKRMLETAPLVLLFRIQHGHELSERARQVATRALRHRFAAASAQEKVGLIVSSEGRCLRMLVGVPLDGKSVALLCRRGSFPQLLIRNLAAWPSCPPPIIQHLAKQPVVRRSTALKRLLLKHPNCPAQLKMSM